jgi:hypothetical protein
MAHCVHGHFDINGQEEGRLTLACNGSRVKGKTEFIIAWDPGEVAAGTAHNGTVDLIRPGLVCEKTLISDKVTVSPKDPAVPGFVWPTVYAGAVAMFKWTPTRLTVDYEYWCDSSCVIHVTSSLGGSYTDSDHETFGGKCSFPNFILDLRTISHVEVFCSNTAGAMRNLSPGEAMLAQYQRVDEMLNERLIQIDKNQELRIASLINSLADKLP